jgi:hypothetical protein
MGPFRRFATLRAAVRKCVHSRTKYEARRAEPAFGSQPPSDALAVVRPIIPSRYSVAAR